jgi:PAS domain S-box-containing protein
MPELRIIGPDTIQDGAYYRALIERAADLIFVMDAEGGVQWLSPSIRRVLGYAATELEGRNVITLVHPQDREHAVRMCRELPSIPNGVTLAEIRLRHRDGSWRIMETTATNLMHTSAVAGIVVNARDITDQVSARARTRDMAARMRAVAEIAAAVVSTQTEDELQTILVARCAAIIPFDAFTLSFYDAGARTLAFLGSYDCGTFDEPAIVPIDGTPSEIVIDQRRTLITSSSADPQAGGARLTGTGRPSESAIRTPIITQQGVVGVIAVRSYTPSLYTTDDAEVLEAVASLVGGALETMRHRAAKAEADNRILFQATLLDAVGEAVVATDLSGRILYWNRFAEQLFGWSAGEAIGESILELPVIPYSDEEIAPLRHALTEGESYTGELMMRRDDGTTFPGNITLSPLRDRAGRLAGTVGVSSDATRRKGLEEQLRQAQKMEAIGRLAGGVAHDFNNVLVAIGGNAQMALEQLSDESPLRGDLIEITRGVERAATLTNQLLAFSRKQVLQPKNIELSLAILNLESMLRRLIGEHINLFVTGDPQRGHVEADPGQIEQVLLNLVVNARDAMPAGGQLHIGVASVDVAPESNEIVDMPPGPYVRLSVADTGEGMDAHTRTRVFEPFFTTKQQGQGTGLGLATVYGIVKQSGGYIDVQSDEELGTRFDVYLPRIIAAGESPRAAAVPPSVITAKPATILLVEDDRAVRLLVKRVLDRQGYKIIEAQNGGDAVMMAERYEGTIDLLISDVVMPLMSGPDVAAHITKTRPDIKVMFVSGYTDDMISDRVGKQGFRFLPKPFNTATLLRDVARALNDPR